LFKEINNNDNKLPRSGTAAGGTAAGGQGHFSIFFTLFIFT